MRYSILLVFLSVFSISSLMAQEEMNNTRLEEILKSLGENFDGETGSWKMQYGEQILFIITDETNNRMRIFTPIMEKEDLGEGQLEAMLEANFHAALDAKYALFNGVVASLFTHPLKELSSEQLIDAVKQVATAANNFGTTYSSTNLIFGGGLEEEAPKNSDKKINKKPEKKTK